MTNIIKTENLNLWYGENQALKNINIEIPEKSITAFIGPSGCGKSTIAHCINGLIPSSYPGTATGSLTIGGRNAL